MKRLKYNLNALYVCLMLFFAIWVPFSIKFDIYNSMYHFLTADELNQNKEDSVTEHKKIQKKIQQKDEWKRVNTRNKLKRKTILKKGLLKDVILIDDEGWKNIIWKGYMEHVISSPIFNNDSVEWMRMSQLQLRNPNDRWNMGHRNRYIEKKKELYELMKNHSF